MEKMMSRPLVIYHGNCADGFTAAWAVDNRLGASAEYYAATHGNRPPDVAGMDVIMVDFCYKRDVLDAMAKEAASILVLDHHKTAALPKSPCRNGWRSRRGLYDPPPPSRWM